jgi:2,4-dienoyl-CoA reductase-like NADH-dependent reductase (Old Yellow Enzyme family)/thioredoxin reductase
VSEASDMTSPPEHDGLAAAPPYEVLLTPLAVKGVTIRNRVMSTAHTSGAGEDGKPKERYQRYHEEKARGGIGLTVVGGSAAVAPDTPGAAMLHLDASTDAIVPWYRQLAERIHQHGATAFGQLAHMGRRANYDNEHWIAPVAPSAVREPTHRAFPRVAESWDIERLTNGFAAAARRVRDGGLDGVELSATHGHLIDQFWSPRVNHRRDGYGGSLRNRMRFSLELLEAVRAAVGDDFVVGLRMSGDELIAGGLTGDDCIQIATILVEEGGVDYLSVLGGQAENLPSHAAIFPGMHTRPAPFASFARAIKRAVTVPVFYAQRVPDLGTAARLVAAGDVDMVGMTRAHLADPHIVAKLSSGRTDEIRPCVGANYCIDRLYAGGQAFCLHNAATGREQTMPHVIDRAPRRRRIVIVGAGPGGLEAARVCAERGHEVILFERSGQTGGRVAQAAKATWRAPLRDITRWLERRVRALGVDVRLGTAADADTIVATEPDVVVLATGGEPARPPMLGAEHAVTTIELLESPRYGGQALVFDDNGAEPALSAAELLALNGAAVTFVTPDPAPGTLLERTTRPTFLTRLYRLGVDFVPDSRLTGIERVESRLRATIANEYAHTRTTMSVDHVIVEHGTVPDTSLFEQLRPGSSNGGAIDLDALAAGAGQPAADEGYELHRVGDALASRNIHAAVFDALRLCKDL